MTENKNDYFFRKFNLSLFGIRYLLIFIICRIQITPQRRVLKTTEPPHFKTEEVERSFTITGETNPATQAQTPVE